MRKVLLGTPELAAVLSHDTYSEKVSVLAGRLHEELRASAAGNVFDSFIKKLFAEASQGEPQGEG